MAQLTKRQKIRLGSWLNLVLAAVLLAGIAAVIVLMARRASVAERENGVLPETTAQTPAPSEEVGDDAADAAEAAPERADEDRPEPTPVIETDPLPEVDLTSWELRLVRNDRPLAEDFVPELEEIERGERFDARAAVHLKKLIADAREAGYGVYVCSGYRAYEVQYTIYWNHVTEYERQGMTREEAEAATRLAVNAPGGSEHQLGLAMDLLEYESQEMESWIGGSGLMLWLEQRCADYGFIIRYPDGKTPVTGVEYEPWHLRYVGAPARYIMEHELCLEEFLALYDPESEN